MIVEGHVLGIEDRADIDTDRVRPAHLLTGVETTGLGRHLFRGMPGGPQLLEKHPEASSSRDAGELRLRQDSREHAAWSLKDRGFRAVIAPSFARIFTKTPTPTGSPR